MRTNRTFIVNLREAKRIYLRHPLGLKDSELAALLRVPLRTARRYRQMLATYRVSPGRYSSRPDLDDLDYAQAVIWRTEYDDAERAAAD